MPDDPNPSTTYIDVVIEDPEWECAVPEVSALVRRVVATALERSLHTGGRRVPEVSLVLSDDARVQSLNHGYRGQNKPTNVLSFPLEPPEAFASGNASAPGNAPAPVPGDGGPWLLGDVILARQTVCQEALAQGKPLEHHLSHLVVHGVLHLLGHDHEDDKDAEKMEGCEIIILEALGIPDPYGV